MPHLGVSDTSNRKPPIGNPTAEVFEIRRGLTARQSGQFFAPATRSGFLSALPPLQMGSHETSSRANREVDQEGCRSSQPKSSWTVLHRSLPPQPGVTEQDSTAGAKKGESGGFGNYASLCIEASCATSDAQCVARINSNCLRWALKGYREHTVRRQLEFAERSEVKRG